MQKVCLGRPSIFHKSTRGPWSGKEPQESPNLTPTGGGAEDSRKMCSYRSAELFASRSNVLQQNATLSVLCRCRCSPLFVNPSTPWQSVWIIHMAFSMQNAEKNTRAGIQFFPPSTVKHCSAQKIEQVQYLQYLQYFQCAQFIFCPYLHRMSPISIFREIVKTNSDETRLVPHRTQRQDRSTLHLLRGCGKEPRFPGEKCWWFHIFLCTRRTPTAEMSDL